MAPRKNYTPEQMGRAIEAVRNGAKIAIAAKSFGVPRITLYSKVAGKTPINCKMGPDTVLPKEQENILVKWLSGLRKKQFPVSKECLQDSVQKIIVEQNIPNPFTNNRPGKTWCQAFLRRHQVVVKRMLEKSNVSEKDIINWFQKINSYLEENNLKEVVKDPNRVFNADESAFFLSPEPGHVLAKKGDKHLYTARGDEKDKVTVFFTGNAAGLLAPPMIVVSYERLPIAVSLPENWAIGKSETGWVCSRTFYEYITDIFNPWLQEKQIPKPVIFFLDSYKSLHLTLHLSNFCAQNGIQIIGSYPNSTSILQPMELSVFRPLNLFWKQAINEWKIENPGQNLKKETFAPVLQQAVANLTDDCIQNGFRAGGLCPFGPENIDMTKLKYREEQEPSKSNFEITAFVQYLESEIIKEFSLEKLNQFNKILYKNRNAVDNCLPDDDVALFVIWAKNKSACDFNTLLSHSVIVNNRSNPEPTSPTILGPSSNSHITGNYDLSHGLTASIPENSHNDHESSNKPEEDFECQSAIPTPTRKTPVTKEDVPLEAFVSAPDSIKHSNTDLVSLQKPSNYSTKSNIKEHDTAIPGTSNYRSHTITPQKKSTDADLGIIVPAPSKRILLWPKKDSSKKKTRIKNETIPSAETSIAWRNYLEKKEMEKKKQEEEKAKRAKERQEKKMKEKAAEKSKKKYFSKSVMENLTDKKVKSKSHLQLKRKKVFFDDSTSEDSDLEIKYAESDDSYNISDDLEEKDENDFPFGEEKRVELSSDKKKKKKTNSKEQQRQQKRQRTYSYKDVSDSGMDVPLSMFSTSKTLLGSKKIISAGCYVIVMHEGEFFPGKVEDVNEKQYEVSTMTFSSGNSYRWTDKPDKIWYREDQVVEEIDEPVCINKRGSYKIKEMDKYYLI